jgi:HSP20 family protein
MNLIRKNSLTPSLTSSSRDEFFFPIEQYFNKFYQDFFKDFNYDNVKTSVGYPKMDIFSDDEHLYIKAALPGMKAGDVKLEILPSKGEEKILQISGKMSEEFQSEKDAQYFVKELKKSTFLRQIILPSYVSEDEPETKFKDGILTIKWKRNERKKIASKVISIKEE